MRRDSVPLPVFLVRPNRTIFTAFGSARPEPFHFDRKGTVKLVAEVVYKYYGRASRPRQWDLQGRIWFGRGTGVKKQSSKAEEGENSFRGCYCDF